MAIVWDPNNAIDIGEWLICRGGLLEILLSVIYIYTPFLCGWSWVLSIGQMEANNAVDNARAMITFRRYHGYCHPVQHGGACPPPLSVQVVCASAGAHLGWVQWAGPQFSSDR